MARERKRGRRRSDGGQALPGRATCQWNSRRIWTCSVAGDATDGLVLEERGHAHASPVPSRACAARKRHGRVGRRARADRAGLLELGLPPQTVAGVVCPQGPRSPVQSPRAYLSLAGTTVLRLRATRRTRSGFWLRCPPGSWSLVDTAECWGLRLHSFTVLHSRERACLHHGRDQRQIGWLQTVRVNRDIQLLLT